MPRTAWKNGDLIHLTGTYRGRLATVFYVSEADLRNGVNALTPGFYAFSQPDHGRNARSLRNYGKIYPAVGRRVGRVRSSNLSPFLLKSTGIGRNRRPIVNRAARRDFY